ncbi:MAG: hypothetical protein ABIP97_08895, partial [Chthoniobacterales bacterium]
TPGTPGGFGMPKADGGVSGADAPERDGGFGMPGIDGGFGIPGTEGGLGIEVGADAAGIADAGAEERGLGMPGIDGGFGMEGIPVPAAGGAIGGLEIEGDGEGIGFGGRLIIADSRGFAPTGWPCRGGSTIRTVSFFGSLIKIKSGSTDEPS